MRKLVLLIIVIFGFVGGVKAQEVTVQVKVFLATECPISQKYIAQLNVLHKKYGAKGVQFVAIFPGKVAREDIHNFVKNYALSFEVKSDKKLRQVKQYDATITPEVVLLKGKEVVYQGAIDNWFYELGKYRKEVTESYLVDALEALLAGKEPTIKKTEAIGCFIEI